MTIVNYNPKMLMVVPRCVFDNRTIFECPDCSHRQYWPPPVREKPWRCIGCGATYYDGSADPGRCSVLRKRHDV